MLLMIFITYIIVSGFVFFSLCNILKYYKKKIDILEREKSSNAMSFSLLAKWINLKQNGKNISEYFIKNNFMYVAIYGMGLVGKALCRELADSGVTVKYAIDQNAERIWSDCELVTLEDDLEKVDVIVVTPIYYFKEIQDALSNKTDCSTISIEMILNQL